MPERLKNVKDAIDNNKFEKVKMLSHQIKGSSGNLRITSIYEVALKLEKAAINLEKVECEKLFEELQMLFH